MARLLGKFPLILNPRWGTHSHQLLALAVRETQLCLCVDWWFATSYCLPLKHVFVCAMLWWSPGRLELQSHPHIVANSWASVFQGNWQLGEGEVLAGVLGFHWEPLLSMPLERWLALIASLLWIQTVNFQCLCLSATDPSQFQYESFNNYLLMNNRNNHWTVWTIFHRTV